MRTLRAKEQLSVPRSSARAELSHSAWYAPLQDRHERYRAMIELSDKRVARTLLTGTLGRDVRNLNYLAWSRGRREEIVVGNGPEFQSLALERWVHERGVALRFIAAGKPVQNCFIENFNGSFRDDYLNEHWFLSLSDAQRKIERLREECNTSWPHRLFRQMTPAAREATYRYSQALPPEST